LKTKPGNVMTRKKNWIIYGQRAMGLAVLVLLETQCQREAVDGQASTGTCRIRQQDMVETSSGSGINPNDNTEKTTYAYDENGNLTRQLTVYEQRQQTRLINRTETDDVYTYDAAGFVTARSLKTQWQNERESGSYGEQTTYAYADGRLTEATRQQSSSADGLVFQTKTRYAYEASGGLSRQTQTVSYPVVPAALKDKPLSRDGEVVVITYQNGQPASYVKTLNGVETRPYTYQNGNLESYSSVGGRYMYSYDAERRLIKAEYWQNGQLKSEEQRTYADGRTPASTLPPFKGWPARETLYGGDGLLGAITYRSAIPNGTFYTQAAQTTFQRTGAGYPTASKTTTTNTNFDSQNSVYTTTTTRTYIYDGLCE
jgi:YD repeat-containing protein